MAKLFECLKPTIFFFCAALFLLLSVSVSVSGVEGSSHSVANGLFVFGDSYVDTGNINKSLGGIWKEPYGITFPGKPSGRFSDGRVLTDFIAKFLGLKSPIPYTYRKSAIEEARHGVNFAFGGTGVLDALGTTVYGFPNMTTQIDLFQQLLSGHDVVHINTNLTNSVALVSVSGNDYNAYIIKNNGSILTLPVFVVEVVHQIKVNLKRLLGLGFRNIFVTGLPPLGCIPQVTADSSFKECNEIYNFAVQIHNSALEYIVAKLNNHTHTHIHILHLYHSFLTAFHQKNTSSGGSMFENPLKPCCLGTDKNSSCSTVDKNGKKLYTMCDDRSAAFFWDMQHPTQAGWGALFPYLNVSLT